MIWPRCSAGAVERRARLGTTVRRSACGTDSTKLPILVRISVVETGIWVWSGEISEPSSR